MSANSKITSFHFLLKFRVFIEQIGPLQESIVWVDESKTVPGRNLLRNVGETNDNEDALELGVDPLVFLLQFFLF